MSLPIAIFITVFMLLAAVLFPDRVLAQSNVKISGEPMQVSAKQSLQMGVGKSIIVDLPQDASEIFVGNPSIVNAVVRSARKIYLVAAANGQTSIFAMNKEGKQIAVIEVSVGRDIDELRALLKAALPASTIEARTVADTIILTGSVDTALEAQKAADIANAFVGYTTVGASTMFGTATVIQGKLINSIVIRSRDQVMLKVTIAEVQRIAVKQLGINTQGNWGAFSSQSGASALSGSTLSGDYYKSAGVALNGTQGNLSAILQAFERNGVGHILAEPNVTAVSGESAKFTAGGEVPVYSSGSGAGCTSLVTAATSCSVSYGYKPYGRTLNFTPVVLSEGRIQLHLATEVAEVDSVGGGRRAVNLHAEFHHASTRDNSGVALRRLCCVCRPHSATFHRDNRCHARPEQFAGLGQSVPVSRLSEKRNRTDDCGYAIYHQHLAAG